MSEHSESGDRQIFARMSCESGVVTARLAGPQFGEREGTVVAKMIEAEVTGSTSPVRFVVLDFADISFINSAGLGACVAIQRLASRGGEGRVVLYAMSEPIRSAFKLVRLDRLFDVVAGAKKLAKLVG